MPNRIIRESILTSEPVASLDWASEVFYRRLLSVVDDYGRIEANHQLLRSKCYPLQTDSVRVADIARWMAACQKSGLILVYGVNGKQYLEVSKFDQRTRTASKCPAPDGSADICGHLRANDGLDVDVDVDVDVDDKRPQAVAWDSGIDPVVVRDFKALRKAKKAAITETAIAGIRREAKNAGLTLEQALRTCCERGWTGFKAEWVRASGVSGQPQPRRRRDLDAEADAMRARMGAAA